MGFLDGKVKDMDVAKLRVGGTIILQTSKGNQSHCCLISLFDFFFFPTNTLINEIEMPV